jgi:hypothetical protein
MPDILFQGNGDGTFSDVSQSTGLSAEILPGFSVISSDLNNDRWPDLFVANDGQPNTMWLNETGIDTPIRLRSVGMEEGCALDVNGNAQGSMGIACGDMNRDGLLDLGVSNYYHEYYTLYRRLAGGGFEDVSIPYRVAGATRVTMGWGTQFTDCDNDGWLDLFVTNGHINRSPDGITPYAMRAQLFRNVGGSRFDEAGRSGGAYFEGVYVGRGAAFGDYDNDGLEDIAVVHHHTPAALLHNETRTDNASLVIKLVGKSSARDAMNARISATVRDDSGQAAYKLVRELTPGTSYLSANDMRLRIGISRAVSADICVQWPGGHEQVWNNLEPGGTKVLREMESGVGLLP